MRGKGITLSYETVRLRLNKGAIDEWGAVVKHQTELY